MTALLAPLSLQVWLLELRLLELRLLQVVQEVRLLVLLQQVNREVELLVSHFLPGQQVDCLIFYSVFTADHLNLTSSQCRARYDINQMSTGQFLCLSDWRTTHHLYHCVNLMVQLAVGKISTRLIYFSKISLFSML